MTFAQRFGSALNLNPHFHSLLLDGMFNTKTNTFHSAPSLKDEDVIEIVETTHRVIRMLKRTFFSRFSTGGAEPHNAL